MVLSDVQFEEFMSWLGLFDENTREMADYIRESMSEVPVIERLLLIFNNALESGAEENMLDRQMLDRSRDVVNVLLALHRIEKGTPPPSETGIIH